MSNLQTTSSGSFDPEPEFEDQISHLSDDSEHFHEEEYKKQLRGQTKPHLFIDHEKQTHDTRGRINSYLSSTDTKNQEDPQVSRVTTSGHDQQYIHIDNKKYLRSELIQAFGGSLVPGYQPRPTYLFANPAPLGLSAFALTTFVLSLANVQARSVKTPNIVVGLAIFYGGFIQLLAGMWEIALNNAFGGTALSSYGGFWLSFGAIYIDFFGITKAYTSEKELQNAVGFYLLGWAIFTFGLTLVTLKSTLAFFSLFFSLTITFILLSAGNLAMNTNLIKAGGVFGIITAFIAWYNAFAGLATRENSYFIAHVIHLPENIFKKNN